MIRRSRAHRFYIDHLDFVLVGTPRENITYDISITDLESGSATACAYEIQESGRPNLTCTSEDDQLTIGATPYR